MSLPPNHNEQQQQNSNKKAKVDVAAIAWEHYRNFLDSQEQDDDNQDGDIDELVELLEILAPHLNGSMTADNNFQTIESLLSVLCSVAHYHLADYAINQSVDQEHRDHDTVAHHLRKSLEFFPQNAATWSMGANYARMTQRSSPFQISAWYVKAAECAAKLRKRALELLEGPNQVEDDAVKEWIELLLLDGIVGAEYVGGDDDDDEEDEDAQENSSDQQGDANEEEEQDGYFSSSSVEATSRFMAAMLLSTLGKHDEAKQQLQGFQLTHRLHPIVWTSTPPTTAQAPVTKLSLHVPYSFPDEALPRPLYNRLCQVLAPDAPYWKESDYAHRGYYSYFVDIDETKPPSNLIEEIIVQHLLPRAQHVLKSAGDVNTKIIGAEWWPHTRPIQANLGHQLHFDTDEALLAQEGNITHPILSSVLYLTGNDDASINNNPAGATIILDQTPDSTSVASKAWKSVPMDNTFMVFPGNKLHGVLPCPGNVDESQNNTAVDSDTLEWEQKPSDDKEQPVKHRLTFMVGFWTRCVPDKMKERHLYGPCGPLPPATEEHSWVKEIQEGYPNNAINGDGLNAAKLQVISLPRVSPAWESIAVEEKEKDDLPLELPGGIDHRFFVRGAPEFFRESLFHKD